MSVGSFLAKASACMLLACSITRLIAASSVGLARSLVSLDRAGDVTAQPSAADVLRWLIAKGSMDADGRAAAERGAQPANASDTRSSSGPQSPFRVIATLKLARQDKHELNTVLEVVKRAGRQRQVLARRPRGE